MTFRFLSSETVPDGVRRMAAELTADAVDRLTGTDEPDVAVHEARKRGKELRGLLRLVRGELGRSTFSRENTAVGDAGRTLSDLRDAHVLLEALDGLLKAAQRGGRPDPATGVRAALAERAAEATGVVRSQGPAVATAVAIFEDVGARVADWPLSTDGFDAVSPGLRRAYGNGRAAMEAAAPEPTIDALHEWRKRVKDLWYGVRVLRSSAPPVLAPLASRLHELSDLLGDDHDMAVLAETLCASPDDFGGSGAVDSVAVLAADRRRLLQRHAFALGSVIYAEQPKAFVSRMDAYWRSWRASPFRT